LRKWFISLDPPEAFSGNPALANGLCPMFVEQWFHRERRAAVARMEARSAAIRDDRSRMTPTLHAGYGCPSK
jgi:hypothetical protein